MYVLVKSKSLKKFRLKLNRGNIMHRLLIALLLVSNYGQASPSIFEEQHCLALNIYYEARSESLAGQYAVADVVLNRVASNNFPDTICGVIKQGKMWDGHPIRNQCQFSWYCDGKPDVPAEKDAWYRSLEIAQSIMYDGRFRGITEGANHYHTHYVDPSWNRNMRLIGSIGDHIFYYEER